MYNIYSCTKPVANNVCLISGSLHNLNTINAQSLSVQPVLHLNGCLLFVTLTTM